MFRFFPLPPELCCCSSPHPPSSSSSTSCFPSLFSAVFLDVGDAAPPPHLPQQVALRTLPPALGEEPHHERSLAADAAQRPGRLHMLTFTSHEREAEGCVHGEDRGRECFPERPREVLILNSPSHPFPHLPHSSTNRSILISD